MPPKKKTPSVDCNLCCRPISENRDEALQCEGHCRQTFHRYCAGVSVTHYKQFNSDSRPFVCLVCNQLLQNERVSQLASELERLKAELATTKEQLAKVSAPCLTCFSSVPENEQRHESTNPVQGNTWTSVVNGGTKHRFPTTAKSDSHQEFERAKLVSSDQRKFNVVIYGIKECQKGTPRHVRTTNDTNSAGDIIQDICPNISNQAIRDTVRLGSYTEGRNRPLLAKLNRSCDVLSILTSRQKLSQSNTPRVFIKPHQSPIERTTEATLLRQRKLLIESGTDKKDIRIRGNSIFVKKKKYGSASASDFKLYVHTGSSDSDENNDNTQSTNPSMHVYCYRFPQQTRLFQQ